MRSERAIGRGGRGWHGHGLGTALALHGHRMSTWSYSTVVCGRRIEARIGSMYGQRVLVDGAVASDQPLASVHAPGHFFTLADETGAIRNIEVRLEDRSWGLGLKYEMVVRVDGVEVRRVGRDRDDGALRCRRCGYGIEGLAVENGEIRCPECGESQPGAR